MSSLNHTGLSPADNEYFEDQNLDYLPAAHPLYSRMQNALKETLEKDHERVHMRLREKEDKLKKNERAKEDIAVQLYDVQQNLATLHVNLEQTHSNYNLLQKLRIDAEQKLSLLNQEYADRQVQSKRLDQNVIRAQDDLSKVLLTLKQLEAYNEEAKNQTALARRITYRAEENMALQEKEKKQQDFLLDHLTEQKKKFSEELAVLSAQTLAQLDEKKAARDILQEAFAEMDSIKISKKNLIDRWQQALLEMSKRDKALQVARDASKALYEGNAKTGAEIIGVTKETKKEGEHAELLAINFNKSKLEEKILEEETLRLNHEQQKLNAQIRVLQQSLQSTETSTQQVEKENKKSQDQMHIIEENIMKIHTQASNLIDQIIVKINEHKTLEKTSANFLKKAQQIEQLIGEKEIEKENTENEYARVQLDVLNTTNQIDVLTKKKREVSEERMGREKDVARLEFEMREAHDINEKKMKEVGKLNKIHDKIVSVAGVQSKGPLDAHKNHLVNSLKEVTDEIHRLEKEWIRKQTNLVKFQEQHVKYREENGDMKTKKAVLEQKRTRLHAILKNHDKDIRSIKIDLKNLQTEMNKLNDGLAKNQHMELKLTNENFNIQSDVIEKLKELEKNNVKLEIEIDSVKEQKADLLQSIVEAERQLLLWERKIQLEKEIQAALDPNIGQSELKVLKGDIHRMELRLEEIKRRQEQTIHEMERQIHKRDTIQLKYIKTEDDDDVRSSKDLKSKITRQIETLRGTLAQTTKNNKEYDKKLYQLQLEIDQKNDLMNAARMSTSVAEEELDDRLSELVQKKIERTKGVFDIVKVQTKYKAFDSLSGNKFKLEASENILKQKLEQQKRMNSGFLSVLKEVVELQPQYADVMTSLIKL